ncbi:alpha/beta hydrolase [Sphingomonas sp. R86521]|uniref:alpha/beta hydrolase n=1 Tax=Sphingomonas sp. R86521 TaxID=3093860 RepID=UPI0036D24B59
MAEDLYRSETLLVRCIPGTDQNRWVVTFDHHSAGPGFDRPGFAEAFLKDAGVSQIAVLGAGNHWYQYRDIGVALDVVRARIAGAAHVVTYGSSMGAYAAIRFAPRLGAHACLAVSPQYSVDPVVVPFEWRWPDDAKTIDWLPEWNGPIERGVRTVVIADARLDDAEHVRRIAADIPIESVSLAYIAHPATTYLNAAGLLQRAVIEMVEDRFDAATFRRDAHARRRQSDVYLGELARLQPASRSRTAIRIARRAVGVAPDSPLTHHVLGLRLGTSGQHGEALYHHQRAVEISERFWGYTLAYSEALAAIGRVDEAFVVAQDMVTRDPHLAPLHHWAGHLHWCQGRRPEAQYHAATACTLAPTNTFYASSLAQYHAPVRWAIARNARWVGRRISRWLPRA